MAKNRGGIISIKNNAASRQLVKLIYQLILISACRIEPDLHVLKIDNNADEKEGVSAMLKNERLHLIVVKRLVPSLNG